MKPFYLTLLLAVLTLSAWGQQSLSLGITTIYSHEERADYLSAGHGVTLAFDTKLFWRFGMSVGANFNAFKGKYTGRNLICDRGFSPPGPSCPTAEMYYSYRFQVPLRLTYRLSSLKNENWQTRLFLGYMPSNLEGIALKAKFKHYPNYYESHWSGLTPRYRRINYWTGGVAFSHPLGRKLSVGFEGSYFLSLQKKKWPTQYAQAEVSAIYRLSK